MKSVLIYTITYKPTIHNFTSNYIGINTWNLCHGNCLRIESQQRVQAPAVPKNYAAEFLMFGVLLPIAVALVEEQLLY